ncbi:MAG: transposase [Erythrobacter sp.]
MAMFDLGFGPSRHFSKRPGFNGTSLQTFFAAFPDDDACLEHLFKTRFGDDPQCPRCGRRGRWQRHDTQKHYFHPCGGIISPMTGVVCSRSHIPLQLWFYAMLHFANSAVSIAAPFLARQLGISGPTAFRLGQRVRLHMAAIDHGILIGNPTKMVMARMFKVLRITNTRPNVQNSAIVLMLTDGKRVNSTVVVKPRQKSLRAIIKSKVHPHSRIGTDCYWTFRTLSNYSSGRPIAEFLPEYYFDRSAEDNQNHGFMQYFNLSFKDQFRGVRLENAWLYLKEYEFRYNRRYRSSETFSDMVSKYPTFCYDRLAQIKAMNFVDASAVMD